MTATAEKPRYLFAITGFDHEPDRTAAPLVIATSALAAGANVLVWVTHEAVQLAKNGAADGIQPASFPALTELLDKFREAGGRIGVCPPCGKTHGVTDDNIVANAEWMGATAVLDAAQERHVFSF